MDREDYEEWKEIRDRFILIDIAIQTLPVDIQNMIKKMIIEHYIQDWK